MDRDELEKNSKVLTFTRQNRKQDQSDSNYQNKHFKFKVNIIRMKRGCYHRKTN